jgi:hypothetical protein
MEFGHSMVGDAAVSTTQARCIDSPRTAEEGLRQARVANRLGSSIWLLYQELLHGQPSGREEDHKVCAKPSRVLCGIGNGGTIEKSEAVNGGTSHPSVKGPPRNVTSTGLFCSRTFVQTTSFSTSAKYWHCPCCLEGYWRSVPRRTTRRPLLRPGHRSKQPRKPLLHS